MRGSAAATSGPVHWAAWCGASEKLRRFEGGAGANALGSHDIGPERMQRIVGDEPPPHQAPQSVDGLARIATSNSLMHWIEEDGAGRCERGKEFFLVLRSEARLCAALRSEQGQLIGQIQRNTTVVFADRLDAGPNHFACCDERVEAGRIVACDLLKRKNQLKHPTLIISILAYLLITKTSY